MILSLSLYLSFYLAKNKKKTDLPYYLKNKEKIWFIQEFFFNSTQDKFSCKFQQKNRKMACLLNFDQMYLNKDISYKLWGLQKSWYLFNRFSKIVFIVFLMCDWQLLELFERNFWFFTRIWKTMEFYENKPEYFI